MPAMERSGQQLVNTRLPYGARLPLRPDPEVVAQQLDSGTGVVSGMKWGLDLKRVFVTVELPITTAAGDRRVISQAFTPSYFARSFEARTIPPSWKVSVVDSTGVIIAERGQPDDPARLRIAPDLLARVQAAPDGALRHASSAGPEVHSYFVRSALSDWAVMVSAPVAEINAAVLRGMSVASSASVNISAKATAQLDVQ
eukprot:gene42112-52206_t